MMNDDFFPQGGWLVNKDSKVLAAEGANPTICGFLPFHSSPTEYELTMW